MAETACTEVGLAEKSKAPAGEKVRERQIEFFYCVLGGEGEQKIIYTVKKFAVGGIAE